MNAVANVPVVTVRRKIKASAEQLFDAWLDPVGLADWMRPCSVSTKPSDVKVDARVGGAFEFVMHVASGPIPHSGLYQLIERPRKLVFTWNSVHAGKQDSLVTVEFRPDGKSTEIVLTHERLPAEAVAGHTGGWTEIIEGLEKNIGAHLS